MSRYKRRSTFSEYENIEDDRRFINELPSKIYKNKKNIVNSSILSILGNLMTDNEIREIELTELSQEGILIGEEFSKTLLRVGSNMVEQLVKGSDNNEG